MVRHFRIWDEFTDGKGNLPPDLMPDKLHLSRDGYRIWAKAITPVLHELLAASGAAADPPAKRTLRNLFSPK